MKRNWKIILLTCIVLLVVILLAVNLYKSGKKEVLSQFREQQFVHAQHLAIQIESFFLYHSWRLQKLSAWILPHYEDTEGKKVNIQDHLESFRKQMGKAHVRGIFLQDESGSMIGSTDRNMSGLIEGQSGFFAWAKKKENRGEVFVSPLSKTQPLNFLLAIPLYQEVQMRSQAREKFVGVLSVMVDLKEFLSAQLSMADPKKSLHELWIMDKGGTLIFHSLHPEMILRNISHGDESCNRCHNSFDYVEKIVKEGRGFVQYKLGNGPEELAAFVPMEFENASWVIVVNTPFDRVTAFAWKSLQGYMLLLGIVIAALIGSSTWIIRNSRLKVKAEEEAKHWREKEALEDTIRRSDKLYRTLVETMNDGLGAVNEDGFWTYANDRLCEMSGYSRDEIVGRPVTEFLDEGSRSILRDQMVKRKGGQREIYELSAIRKDGQKIFVLVSPKAIFDADGQFKGSFAVITDISQRKNAEEALKESEIRLRHLSSQLLTAQETERRRISRELHDELGQALTLMKIRLRSIEKALGKKQAGMREECQNILQYIDQIIENVRRLSRDLSPAILEDLGLTAALRWLIDNFVKNDSIQVSVDIPDINDLFSEDRQIIIYRTLQEVLTNIGKHAHARNVSLAVQKYDGRVSFTIHDDGRGFDLAQAAMKKPPERGLGLAIMDERARMLGGSLEIWSEEGKGTRITLHIPTRNPLAKEG